MSQILLLIILLLVFYIFINKKEKFTNLNEEKKEAIINSILVDKEFTNKNNLNRLRNKYDWMDPIIYEDIKQLNRNSNLNRESLINKLF
jgi:hypothetical protein